MRNRKKSNQRPQINRDALRRSISYLGIDRKKALLPYIFAVIATLSLLAVPRMLSNIIDAIIDGYTADVVLNGIEQIPEALQSQAIPQLLEFLDLPADWTAQQLEVFMTNQSEEAPSTIILAGVAIVLFAALRGVFAFLQAYGAERNSQGVAFNMRNDLFAKIQNLSFSYHDRNQTGQLMVRATDDVEKVRLFIGQGLIQLMSAILLLSGTLIILFTTNARLTFTILWVLPVSLVLFMVFGTISQPLFREIQVRLSRLNTRLQENLAGIKVVKAFTREKNERRKFDREAGSLMKQQITVARVFTFLFPVIFLVANLGQATTLYFGGRQIIAGTLTLGQWQEFSLYLAFIFLPLAQFGLIITQMGQASASATRVFEIMDAKNEVEDKPDAVELPTIQGLVKFDNVTFRYYKSGEPVLKNVSFEAQPGQTVALLGVTGSGKTTIINLIPRFYDPSEGSVTIDGYDLRDIKLDSLRSQIGIVLQETTLFAGTIRDNIAFGKTNASQEEIENAAKAAAAHEFILSFPQGYETPVGERGTTLSGGQKQRLAIARALLLNPHILILDDSTSSVDVSTEVKIQEALDELMEGRTSFVIAQRISTVVNADQILVLDKGEIVARGQHEELMEESAIYAEIYNSQLVSDAEVEDNIQVFA